jgi:tRNA pseudouridine55 synthase
MNAKTANQFESIEEFLSGTLLLIDKPLGWTSFDVMGKIKAYVRHHLSMPQNANGDSPKFKVGHAGTLDPLATGLLVVCTGKMTKSIDSIQSGLKEYTGTIYLGKTTPSYDLETEPEGEYSTEHITEESLREVAASFIGEQWQTPPIYSAKQVNGKRAYESARAGQHVDIPPSLIHIHAFEITRIELPQVDFLIRCSKGTYIRTIANDFGKRLQSGSYLKALRRTESHPYRIEDSMTPEALMLRLDELKANSELAKK